MFIEYCGILINTVYIKELYYPYRVSHDNFIIEMTYSNDEKKILTFSTEEAAVNFYDKIRNCGA